MLTLCQLMEISDIIEIEKMTTISSVLWSEQSLIEPCNQAVFLYGDKDAEPHTIKTGFNQPGMY
jgi:hypothetical protein